MLVVEVGGGGAEDVGEADMSAALRRRSGGLLLPADSSVSSSGR